MADKEKTFTQTQLDSAVANAKRELKAEIGALKQQLVERPTREDYAASQAALQHLKETHSQQLAEELGMRDRQMSELQRKVQTLETDVADREHALHQERVLRTFGDALDRADVYAPARSDALRSLMAEMTGIERGDDGQFRATWGELERQPPAEIAKAFLADRTHFATARVGGAGTQPPNGRRLRRENTDTMTAGDFFEAAGPDPSTAS